MQLITRRRDASTETRQTGSGRSAIRSTATRPTTTRPTAIRSTATRPTTTRPTAIRPTALTWLVLACAATLAGCDLGGHPTQPSTAGDLDLSGGVQGPVPPGGRPERFVPGQVVCEVGPGYTIEDVHALFGTATLRHIEGTGYYLVSTPPGAPEGEIALAMRTTLLCDIAELNHLLEAPEAERYSIAFYEGSFNYGDYVDQDALLRIGAPIAHLTSTGAGVRVAVVDTGIDLDHPALAGSIGAGYDLIDDDASPDDLPNRLDDDGDGLVDEAAGHGTHVAGIVSAVAPGAILLPYRVLDSDGVGTAFDVTAGVLRAIDAGAQVINLSLGLDARVDALREAIRTAADLGIVVVSSAGNRGIEDRYHFPASENNSVVAVTAVDAGDIKAPFASFGSHVDLSAPGVGIMSTYWNGGYAIWSGTSMAAPFVSGGAALALAIDPTLGGETQTVLEATALDLDAAPHMWLGMIGEGRVQLDQLVCELDPGCARGVTAQSARR